ncbi:MAG: sugar phosphate isomerase/epimerase, partial [Lentisphaeria bacterium]|nr:sugar phosphate isomerase/epimerase [Lentisphaeria bacterium]
MTGFADEASANIDVQIAVTKELGWKNIEARMMYGNKNIASISDEEFEDLQQKLQEAGVSIN